MSGTGASSPYIKEENDEQFFGSHNNQRFMAGNQQGFGSQPGFAQFSSHGGSIDPSSLTMGGNGVGMPNGGFGSSYQNNFNSQASASYSKNNGGGAFEDDELLEGIPPNDMFSNQATLQSNGHDFSGGMDFNNFPSSLHGGHNGGTALSSDPNHINGYSNTPDGDPIASPYVHGFNPAPYSQGLQLRQSHQTYGSSLHSPYAGSPLSGQHGLFSGSVDSNNIAKQRPGLGVVRKSSQSRGPTKVPGLHINNDAGFSTQPIRTNSNGHRHQKTLSGQWDTPSSLNSFVGSGDFSPLSGVHPNPQISDILKTGSMPTMPTKSTGPINGANNAEMKRRRRRESHNLVERRRRDNINERIQELSHLVPMHRLEDEKVRKALQNNSPLSPTLAGLSGPGMSPPAATSGLAGPGARRATAGNITTGIPIEEKDKGPNKGDILNGAVSWTRDLMWMLHTKLQQQEELAQILADKGVPFPFEETEDERRMHTELMDAMFKNDGSKFHYSRAPGSGLRVPKHTDVKGDPIRDSNHLDNSLSPDNHSTGDAGQAMGQYWSGHNSGGSGAGSVSFKEEDEYVMDLTQ